VELPVVTRDGSGTSDAIAPAQTERRTTMKRLIAVTLGAVLVAGFAGLAVAQGWGPGGGPMGPGPMYGGGRMGLMAGGGGFAGCPGWGAANAPEAAPVTEEKATALAAEYATKYFKGYTVERVLPFSGRFHTMYQAELKGPKGETRVLHVNPWGGVRPFAAPFTN
jgi:hypothetical protein